MAQASDAVVSTATPDTAAQTNARAAPIVTGYPAEAAGDGAVTANYSLARWAEDWTRYRDPALRDDPLDQLKFLSLDRGSDAYLTLSGEVRPRVETITNPGARDRASRGFSTVRIMAGADLHVGSHFRAYGEVAHGGSYGNRDVGRSPNMRNDLVVQQAFGEAKAAIGVGEIGVRAGRQQFADGSGLLVNQGDGGNIQVAFNGVRGWTHLGAARVDLFDFHFMQNGIHGWRDDRIDRSRRFSGLTAGIVVPRNLFGGSRLYVEPFAWRLRRDHVLFGRTDAQERRRFYGVRLWGDAGPVTLDWSANWQDGRFGGRHLSAWQVFAAQTVRLGGTSTAPRLGLHADYGSGGGTYGSGTLRAAAALSLDGGYFSYQDALAPTNYIGVSPNFTISPVARVRVTAEHQSVWRPVERDAVRFASGQPYVGTEAVAGTQVANVTRLEAVWSIAARISATARYEHLATGKVLTRAGYRSTDYLGGWVSFRI